MPQMIIAWTDAEAVVRHITGPDDAAPGERFSPRPWPSFGVAIGWHWDDVGQGFVPPVPVPSAVSMRQARLALLALGVLDEVENILASIPDPTARAEAEIAWEYSTVVERTHPLIDLLSPALGLDAAAVDAMFRQAATL